MGVCGAVCRLVGGWVGRWVGGWVVVDVGGCEWVWVMWDGVCI